MKTSKAAAPAAAFLLATLFTTTPPAFADSPAAPDPVQTALEVTLSTSGGKAPPQVGEHRDGKDGIEDALKTALSAGNSKNGQPKPGAAVPPAEGEFERLLAEKPSVKPGKSGKAVIPVPETPPSTAPDAKAQMQQAVAPPVQPEKPDSGSSLKNNSLLWCAGGLAGILCLGALISAAVSPQNPEEPRQRRRENGRGGDFGGGGDVLDAISDVLDAISDVLDAIVDGSDGGGDGGCGCDITSAQQVRRTVPGGPTVLMP